MILIAESDPRVTKRLSHALARVEQRFNAELHSDLDCVNTLVEHVEQFRGKMLRPTLLLLSGMAAGREDDHEPVSESLVLAATVVEMVHMATLVHDDILDEAALRRRGATINELHGNEAAVMLGDYLISHAYHLCSGMDEPWVGRVVADTTNTVCEGELLQLARRNDWSVDQRTYFQIIERKTASLCGLCSRLGIGLVYGPDAQLELAQAFDQFGRKLGMAFQITDDVLDLTGDVRQVGKTLGRDLEKGKLTLPLIIALESADPAQRDQLEQSLQLSAESAGGNTARLTSGIIDILSSSGGLESARQWAVRLIDDAKAQLQQIVPETPAKRMLLDVADRVVERTM